MVTKAVLVEQIASLKAQHADGLAKANQAFGAVQLAEHLLTLCDDVPDEKAPDDGGSDDAPQ